MTGIGNGPKIVFEIGSLRITETVVMGWLIIVAVLILCLWLTHDLKKVPEKKRQVVAEMLVNFVNNMVKENMGVKMMKYAPYIATLLIYEYDRAQVYDCGHQCHCNVGAYDIRAYHIQQDKSEWFQGLS